MAAAVIAGACAAGIVILALMPLEPIAEIDVEIVGAGHLDDAAAIAASGLFGRPVFQASAAEARAVLLRAPALRDVRVDLSLPHQARIELRERDAAIRWIVGAKEWFVDADGVLFGSVEATAAPALRVRDLRTTERRAGDRLDPALVAAALRLAKIAPGELRADAISPAVRIEPSASGIVLSSGAGWEIRFGTPERIEDKLALALRFLREQPGRRLEYVDVRSPERIVFAPE